MAKVMTTKELIRLVTLNLQRTEGRNPRIDLSTLDDNGKHVVVQPYLHNDTDIRCIVLTKRTNSNEPYEIVLEMTLDDFNNLPDVN